MADINRLLGLHPLQNALGLAPYGFRYGGLGPKGKGFFGPLYGHDGTVSSELSIGTNIGGKEMEIPLLVPTLTKDEVRNALAGELNDEMVRKATANALLRIQSGQSPFSQSQGLYATPGMLGLASLLKGGLLR